MINRFQGFATFKCMPLVNLRDMLVAKELRDPGVRHLLVRRVQRITNEKGGGKITLEALDGNMSAKNSYIQIGFTYYELDPTFSKAMFLEKRSRK